MIFYSKILILLVLFSSNVFATDYTNRKNIANACGLFARDAYVAAGYFSNGVYLNDILEMIDESPAQEGRKQRAFQAVQFVWRDQITEPAIAYTLAMGMCLTPKKNTYENPWLTSLRTNKEYF